jgi:hypothetical protein
VNVAVAGFVEGVEGVSSSHPAAVKAAIKAMAKNAVRFIWFPSPVMNRFS